MRSQIKPLVFSPTLIDDIYEFHDEDGEFCFTMDPDTKQFVVASRSHAPGWEDRAIASFFAGFRMYVQPLIDRGPPLTDVEADFVSDMVLAMDECERRIKPKDTVTN